MKFPTHKNKNTFISNNLQNLRAYTFKNKIKRNVMQN